MDVVVRATQDAKAEDEGRIRLMLQKYCFITLTPTLSLKGEGVDASLAVSCSNSEFRNIP
jgi:hypothetical protein